ncbi:MAG: DUF427 domain-containing protein [Solirubrobacterales bacterium]
MRSEGKAIKAIFNGEVIAESEETIYLEGNHYFPPESVDERYLRPGAMKSLCFWKGLASYYTIEAGGRTGRHAAWTYCHPPPWVRKIRNHVAFWDGVEVSG